MRLHSITYVVCLFEQQPPVGHGLLIHEVSRSHTTTHQDSSGRVISSSQRPLPDNTQHAQQTNIHVSGGIRTHNPSRLAAADLRLRPRGHFYNLYTCTFPSVDLDLLSQQINQYQVAAEGGLMVVRPRYALLNYEEAFPSSN